MQKVYATGKKIRIVKFYKGKIHHTFDFHKPRKGITFISTHDDIELVDCVKKTRTVTYFIVRTLAIEIS